MTKEPRILTDSDFAAMRTVTTFANLQRRAEEADAKYKSMRAAAEALASAAWEDLRLNRYETGGTWSYQTEAAISLVYALLGSEPQRIDGMWDGKIRRLPDGSGFFTAEIDPRGPGFVAWMKTRPNGSSRRWLLLWRNYRSARELSRSEGQPWGHWRALCWSWSVLP